MQNIARVLLAVMLILDLTACNNSVDSNTPSDANISRNEDTIKPTQEALQLEDGLPAVRFEEDPGLDDFLAQGGAVTDREAAEYGTVTMSILIVTTMTAGRVVEAERQDTAGTAMKLAGISNFSAVSTLENTLLPWTAVTLLFAVFACLAAGKIKRVPLTTLISE